MHPLSLWPASLVLVAALGGCHAEVKETLPYKSAIDLSFEIGDGSGTYFSNTRSYLPAHCGAEHRMKRMEIGQENFDAIEGLVIAGRILDAKVETIPACQTIDVELPGERYRFHLADGSVTLELGQCERIDAAHEPYLKAIRQIVTTVAASKKLIKPDRCVYF
jgi:hypothetical protein